jgi:hypothetical protein
MKNLLLRVWIVILLATFSLPAGGIYAADVEIAGSVTFTNQVITALTLLTEKAPEAYEVVTNYVKRIEQGERSGMWAYKKPPTYEMSDKTTFYSLTWCAATIAHDSFHSKLYHDYPSTPGKTVPDSAWTGTDAEKKCMEHQLNVMTLIGSPTNELTYAKQQLKGMFVADKETWDSYKKNGKW